MKLTLRALVGLAEARLVQADRLAEVVLPLLRADPLYLLHPEARREYLAWRESGEAGAID